MATPMRLLSFDGGGIRGLSSLYIIQDMMMKIQVGNDLDTEPLPCDYFDMICGTSTGGIIALMLGRLRMTVSECIEAYLGMSEKVFSKPNGLIHREKFNPTALEKAIQDVVERRLGDRNAPLIDHTCCKTFVCTFDKGALGGAPVLLRTYATGSAPVACTIWEAARATSAAPTFFPPISFQGQPGIEYIDAGIGCNNPTKELLREAKSYTRLKSSPITSPACLVSIGTGQKDLIKLQEAASIFWFKDRVGLSIAPVLAEIATDCEKTHDEVVQACINENTLDRYFRFSVVQGMQKIVLDEWNKAADIKSCTGAYLRLSQVEYEILRCVGDLVVQGTTTAYSPQSGSRRQLEDVPWIAQASNSFHGTTTVTNGQLFQGNFANFNSKEPFLRR